MISFMVLGAPRSSTTWAANWLTTDTTYCEHDPLRKFTLDQVNAQPTHGKIYGVACTAMAMFPAWVNKHPAPKLILHRDVAEINASLFKLGLPCLQSNWSELLDSITGWHVHYKDIFDPTQAKKIYEYLLEIKFDAHRHALLKDFFVEPDIAHIEQDPKVIREMFAKYGGG